MSTARPVIIVNPRSGGGLSKLAWARLVGPLTDGLGSFDTRFTEIPGDGRRLAQEEAAAGRQLVVAMGGDGTISEVAGGLLAHAATGGQLPQMGIIPRGTGGDFRRTLMLPDDLRAAAERVRDGQPHKIDAGQVTLTGEDGARLTRHFVNISSFGFSSDVASRANGSSKRLGAKVAFWGATVRSLLSYQNADVAISMNDGPQRRATVMLGAIGNGRFFGGGMKICPEAKLDDGLLDVVTVGDLGRLEVLRKMHRLYEGTHLDMPQVQVARARTIEVTSADPQRRVAVELDGETPGHLPARFEVLPAALTLRF